MARQYKRKQIYKYSIKQAKAYKNRSKVESKRKHWESIETKVKRLIDAEIRKENLKPARANKIRQFAKKQLEAKEYERIKNIGVLRIDTNESRIKTRAKERLEKRFQNKIQEMKPLVEYIKKESISKITREYGQMIENSRGAYSELFDKAMLNPTKFKELLIDKVDSLKSNMEVEMEFITTKKGAQNKYGDITVHGKTVQEIIEIMNRLRIAPNEIIDSIKLDALKRETSARKVGSLAKYAGKLYNVRFTVTLIRGRL